MCKWTGVEAHLQLDGVRVKYRWAPAVVSVVDRIAIHDGWSKIFTYDWKYDSRVGLFLKDLTKHVYGATNDAFGYSVSVIVIYRIV